jgi:hypothetical protein
LWIFGLEGDPARHVDPAEQPRGVGAVVNVAVVDITLAAAASAMKQIAVAGAIDRHLGADRKPTFLAFKGDAGNPAVFDDRCGDPGMKYEMDARAQHEFLAQQFQVFRVDRRGPGDDSVERRGALFPIGSCCRIGVAPVGARRAGHRIPRQPVDQLSGNSFDDAPARPVGHAVDPDHKSAGRQPAKMIVPLHQHDVGACTRRGDRGGSPGRTAPGDQYIAITEQWHLARRPTSWTCPIKSPGSERRRQR